MSNDELLVAAVVGAARGLKGEVALDVRTDRPQEVFDPGEVISTDSAEFPTLTVESWSTHQGRFLVFFAEIVSREDAEVLRGTELYTPPMSEDDAWYPSELEGLTAVDTSGTPLGVVKGLQFGAAQDLLVVDCDGREVMVPFVSELVPEVLPGEGRVVVNAPAGLFDDDAVS